MLRVKCTNCEKTIKTPPGRAGEQIDCPGCGARITIAMDTPDIDAIRYIAEAKRRAIAAPVPAEAVPAKLDDLLTAQREQTKLLCEWMERHSGQLSAVQEHTNAIATHTFFIGLLILFLVLLSGALQGVLILSQF